MTVCRPSHTENETNVLTGTRIPAERLGAARWRQIVEATCEVISSTGLAKTRLKDVADTAGVSLGLVQHYFRHRDSLISETFTALMDLSLATWRHVTTTEEDPLRRLFALLRMQVGGWLPFRRRWAFWIEFWSATHRQPELSDDAPRIYASWQEPFESCLHEGANAGAFRLKHPVSTIAMHLMALTDGLAVRVLVDDHKINEDGMFEMLIDTACAELDISGEQRRRALTGIPKFIGIKYPKETPEASKIDWAILQPYR